jgi:large subunit ribosomal protein L21
MYAIVNIAGQQYKVEKDQKLFVHRLTGKEGETIRFDEVMLIDNDKSVVIGEPTIKGAVITGKVLSHPKGDKVQVFKKKRRKGYKVQRGHRQFLTEIQIQDIIEKGAAKETKPKAAVKKETKSDTEAKAAAPKAAAKKPTAASKTAPAKKTTAATKKTGTEKKASTVKKPATATKKTTTKKASDGAKAAAKPAAKKSTGTKPKAAPKKPSADK